MAIDTLKVARRLREAGFSEPQADAVLATVQESAEGAELATKADLAELRGTELRLEAKIEAVEADILSRVFGLIVGAMFAMAKLVGH